MKLSLAEVRRRLPPGAEYTGELIGHNATVCAPGAKLTRRRIVKNTTHQMVSTPLEGPKVGQQFWNNWQHVEAQEQDGAIILTMTEMAVPEAYLRITDIKVAA